MIFTAPDQLLAAGRPPAVQPLNLDLVPNLKKKVWPELHSPFYDVGPRYSVPYTLYTTGIGWRNDKIGDFDPPSSAGTRSGSRERVPRARRASSTTRARGSALALMRRGVTDLNTEDPALLERAVEDLKELNEIARVKVTINGYETLPAGRMWLNQVWSGDMLNAVISYLPEGTSADVLSYWYQRAGGPVFNDCIVRRRRRGRSR